MTATISRLYDTYEEASKAVSELERSGITRDDISIVASNADNWYKPDGMTGGSTRPATTRVDRDADGVDDRAEGAAGGAGVGATVGGVAGLLAGLGLLAIPGLGPVVAAGWLAATAAGIAVGGATGGIIGALTQAGVTEEDAQVYAEGVRRGGTLVTVRAPEAQRARVESVLDRASVNLRERGAAYRSAGWKGFDPKASPYSADQVTSERERYRRTGTR